MTGKGWVTSARGQEINMDDLKMQAERPIGFKEAKSEVKPKAPLSKRTPVNIRGFVPAPGEAKVPEMPPEISGMLEIRKDRKIPVRPSKVQSMADITRIKVSDAKFIKGKSENGARAASEDVLSNIMGDLNQDAPILVKAAEDDERASKKVSTKKTKKK